jgi:hypothetical protein
MFSAILSIIYTKRPEIVTENVTEIARLINLKAKIDLADDQYPNSIIDFIPLPGSVPRMARKAFDRSAG